MFGRYCIILPIYCFKIPIGNAFSASGILMFLIQIFLPRLSIDNMRFITYNIDKGISIKGETSVTEFEIIFYDKPDGSEPAMEFILTLDDKMQARVLRTIKLLSENGTMFREPYSKHLVDGIFEIRSKVGTNISRVLYFFVVGRKIVLTNGFTKKTQKTPKSEIELAKKYRNEFLNRGEY